MLYLIEMRTLSILGFLTVFFWLSLGLPQTVLYPGTFDPYHAGHHQELLQAISQVNAVKAVILPIEKAPYQIRRNSLFTFPSVFPYFYRMRFISEATSAYSNIQVSDQLQIVGKNIFETLTAEMNRHNDPRILIGTDVLEIWSQLPGFQDFISKTKLIVSEDPKAPERDRKLNLLFSDNKNIQFIKAQHDGIRSKDLIYEWVASGKAPNHLFPKLRKDFDWGLANNYLDQYLKAVDNSLMYAFDIEVLPILSRTLPSDLLELIKNEGEIRSWMATKNLTDVNNLGLLAFKIQNSNSFERLNKDVKEYLSSILYSALNSSEITEVMNRNSHLFNLSLLSKLEGAETEKSGGFAPDFFKRVNGAIFRFYKKHFISDIKSAVFTGDIAKDFGKGAPIKPAPPHLLKGADWVTVYRGVPYNKDLDKHIESWRNNGMLSKTALQTFLKTGNLSQSLEDSRRLLDDVGTQPSVLHHLFGQWKEGTPWISTSLDPIIAKSFAGANGLVLTFRIPMNQGIFLNDLAYWQNSPWQKDGNAAPKQMEFAVPHQLLPEWITGIERTGPEVPPSEIGMALAWKIKHGYRIFKYRQERGLGRSCLSLFRKPTN